METVTKFELVEIPCDICGSMQSRIYKEYKTPVEYQDIYNAIGYTHQQVVQCQKCGFIFNNPRITEEQFKIISGTDPEVWRPKEIVISRRKDFFEAQIKLIMRYKKGGKLLDIGCSYGTLLETAKEKGFQVYGCEIQEHSAKYADVALEGGVFCGKLESANYPAQFFDVITMYALLEHVWSPRTVLIEANRILKKTGLIIINVPNVNSEIAEKNLFWWNPYHFSHFSSKTLENLLGVCGFKVANRLFTPFVPRWVKKYQRQIYRYLGGVVFLIQKSISKFPSCILDKGIGVGSGLTIIANKQE